MQYGKVILTRDGLIVWFLIDFFHWISLTSLASRRECPNVVPKVVAKNLEKEMPKILEEKIAKQKVKAETEVLKEKHQARYFFEKLKEIRELEKQRKKRNPLARITQRVSSRGSNSSSGSESASTDSTLPMARKRRSR